MAFITENTATGDGSTTDFSFTFPYINESDVKVTITDANGDPQSNTDFTFANATTLSFNTAPTSGRTIRIFRDTNLDNAVVTFFAGSAIRAEDLNDNQNQVLFSAQEVENNAVLTTGSTITGDQVFTTGTVVFEGATADDNETTLAVTDPTADRTITLPNADGHVALFTADPGSTTISATPAELNTLDGITASTAELNLMDGVTATTAELNLLDGVTASTAELNILDGVTATATELNLLDGVTATTAELNFVDGVTSNVQTQLDAKQPLDAELTELATMGSTTAAALADLTQAEVQILDGATVSTAELNLLDGVTATTGELNHVDGVTSNVQTQLNNKQPLDAELTELATMASGTASALADLSQAEVQILDGATVTTTELNTLDGVTASTAELNLLDGVTATTAELNKLDGVTASTTELNALDGITSTVTELNLLDGVTSTTAELNILDGVTATASELNQLDGNTLSSSSTDFTSSSQYPSAAEIDSRITARIDPIDGFVAIADEDSFPTTTPPEGTAVSISNAGGMVIGASASTTDASRAGGSDTVTIQNIPTNMQSQTIQDGLGMVVIATSTAHTYDFHRVVATNADVVQLSSDIDDFKARYRVGASNPTTSLDEGDLFYNTGSDKMLVYDGSAWAEVQSIGEYFIIPASELADFASGSASTEVISNAPANATQIILSINGVIQEPNSGTTAPTDGFALDGSTIRLAATPPASSEVWGVIIGSTVNIGTPSAGTVGPTQLADTTVTAGSYTLSSITVDAQGRITAASSGSAADPDIITEGNTSVEVVDTGSDGHITFDTEGVERMRIDSSGNVGIGTNSPTFITDIQADGGGGTERLRLFNTGSATNDDVILQLETGATNNECLIWFGDSADNNVGQIRYDHGTDSMEFLANASERMRITSSGNIGINSTIPRSKLHVANGNSNFNPGNPTGLGAGAVASLESSGDVALQFLSSTSTDNFIYFGDTDSATTGSIQYDHNVNALSFNVNGGTERLRITSAGNVGIGTANPGAELHVNGTIRMSAVPGTNTNSEMGVLFQTSNGDIDGGSSITINPAADTLNVNGASISSGLFRGTGSSTTFTSANGNGFYDFRATSDSLRFIANSTTNTEAMRINSSGQLLVGATNSTQAGSIDAKVQVISTDFNAALTVRRNQASDGAPGMLFCKSRGTSNSANVIVNSGDGLGNIRFFGADGTGGNDFAEGGAISCVVDGTPGSDDLPGRLEFKTTSDGASSPIERMRITSEGYITNKGNSIYVDNLPGEGFTLTDHRITITGETTSTTTAAALRVGRDTHDGELVSFHQDSSKEGTISVSGTTVSYNGGHLSRWSQTLTTNEHVGLLKGTVMTNLDEMCEWPLEARDEVLWTEEDKLPEGVSVGDVRFPARAAGFEDNEQLNKMAVSSVEGDPNVAGVIVNIDSDDDLNVAMTGDFIIRIAQGTTVARGDLLMSAGDGTAKPQDDDIVRSKTIAKVTSTTVSETYADGSYCVPCVLMAC